MFATWDKNHFPELISGNPVQVEQNLKETESVKVQPGDNPEVSISGTPACPGVVSGRVRIVTHISGADKIQPGDILITHSTDIGWSPYFPILSGVVTELGGLISHGAVVAREYGLPCLVGVAGATQMFRDQDTVCLDAVRGILTKVTNDVDS